MGSYDNPPLWPAGHKITDAETAIIYALLSATGVNGGLLSERAYYKTADQTYLSQTTLQNDADFVVPMLANAIYAFYGFFYYITQSTPLFKVAWTLPSGASGMWQPLAVSGAVSSATTGVMIFPEFSMTTGLNMGTNGTNGVLTPHGTIICGSTAGNAVFQHAQQVSAATSTGMKAGSWLIVKRLA